MTENVVWHPSILTREQRWSQLGSTGIVVWFTGLSGAGKSTIATALEQLLVTRSQPVIILDGDNLRHGLNADLGFDEAGRTENIRRVGEVAALAAEAGVVAIVPVISPYRASRAEARRLVEGRDLRFIEVFIDTALEECERRDAKGLYAKARRGELPGFTGIDDPYEEPSDPELRLTPAQGDPLSLARLVESLIYRS